MARKDELKSASSNPAKFFLEWKSEDKQFSYYDKEKGENAPVKLPFKFLFLKQMNTVRGWHDKSASGIYSNEVYKVSEEKLTVKSFKGGVIAEGLYKDIKEAVNNAGGHYVRSIYVMSAKGEILNIQLKGSSVQAWGDFTQKTMSRLGDEWVVVSGANEATKGKVKYSVPVFEFGGSLSKDKEVIADERYEEIKAYISGGKAAVEQAVVEEAVEEEAVEEGDDLPF